MIIICDMIEKCSCGIIFEILLIWLTATVAPHLIAWLYVCGNLLAWLQETCLIACANLLTRLQRSVCLSAQTCSVLARLRKPACLSAQTKPTSCVSPARMFVCARLTTSLTNFAACLRKTFCVSL
jgi:hypothetical protein